MRQWLDDPFHPAGGMARLVDKMMADTEATEKAAGNIVRWRDAADKQTVRDFCVELVHRLEPLLDEFVIPYQYAHGQWFKVPITLPGPDGTPRDAVLTGEMDLLVHHPAGPVIWDLKGTADDQYWRKVVAQLVFYDIAVWISSGRKSRGVGLIQPMCTQRTLTWEITDDARRQLMTRIHRYALDVWTGEQSCTTDTNNCRWCDTRHACPRFRTDPFGDLATNLRTAAGEPT